MAEVTVIKSARSIEPSVLDDHRIQVGDFTLDLRARTVRTSRAAPIKLSTNEFAILATLCKTPGRPVPREDLLEIMAIGNADPQLSVVDSFVGHIRNRLVDIRSAATIERSPDTDFTLWP